MTNPQINRQQPQVPVVGSGRQTPSQDPHMTNHDLAGLVDRLNKQAVIWKGSGLADLLNEAASALQTADARIVEAEGKLDAAQRHAQDALDEADARVKALEEGLEPFGYVVDGDGVEDYPDDMKATVSIGRRTHYALTLGHFRRAASLLNPEGGESHD